MLALKDAFFTHHQQCFCRVTVWGLPWVESLPERGGRPSRPCRGKSGVRRRHAGRTTCLRAAQGHSAEPQALREGPGPRRSCWRGLKAAGSGHGSGVMSALPSGPVVCACQVNSLEIDGRKAADGACSRAGARPPPFPRHSRHHRQLSWPGAGCSGQSWKMCKEAKPGLLCSTGLKRSAHVVRRCWQNEQAEVVDGVATAGLLHPRFGSRSPVAGMAEVGAAANAPH